MKRKTFGLFNVLPFILCGIVALLVVAYVAQELTCTRETVMITQVGGCDKDGNCGVLYSNGKKTWSYLPTVGETKSVCKASK